MFWKDTETKDIDNYRYSKKNKNIHINIHQFKLIDEYREVIK